MVLLLLSLSRMVILFCLLVGCFGSGSFNTVRITKVQGHADETVVRDGEVRELDRLRNNAADEAADFGRRRVDFPVIDARRILSGVCGRRHPVILTLHRFFIAISGVVFNHVDGDGAEPDRLVWSAGALPKRRRVVHAVRESCLFAWACGYVGG